MKKKWCSILLTISVIIGTQSSEEKVDVEKFLEKIRQTLQEMRNKMTEYKARRKKRTESSYKEVKARIKKQILQKLTVPRILQPKHYVIEYNKNRDVSSGSSKVGVDTAGKNQYKSGGESATYPEIESTAKKVIQANSVMLPFRFPVFKKIKTNNVRSEKRDERNSESIVSPANYINYLDDIARWLNEIQMSALNFWHIIRELFINDEKMSEIFTTNICKGVMRDFVRDDNSPSDRSFWMLKEKVEHSVTLFNVEEIDPQMFTFYSKQGISGEDNLCMSLIKLHSLGKFITEKFTSYNAISSCISAYINGRDYMRECNIENFTLFINSNMQRVYSIMKKYFKLAQYIFTNKVVPVYAANRYQKFRGNERGSDEIVILAILFEVNKENLKRISKVLRSIRMDTVVGVPSAPNFNIKHMLDEFNCEQNLPTPIVQVEEELQNLLERFLNELQKIDEVGKLSITEWEYIKKITTCTGSIMKNEYPCGISDIAMLLEKWYKQNTRVWEKIIKIPVWKEFALFKDKVKSLFVEFRKYDFCTKYAAAFVLFYLDEINFIPPPFSKFFSSLIVAQLVNTGGVDNFLSINPFYTKLSNFKSNGKGTFIDVFYHIFTGLSFDKYDFNAYYTYLLYNVYKCKDNYSFKQFVKKISGKEEPFLSYIEKYIRCIYKYKDIIKCIKQEELFDSSENDNYNGYMPFILIEFFEKKIGIREMSLKKWEENLKKINDKTKGKYFWHFIDALSFCKDYNCLCPQTISGIQEITLKPWTLCNITTFKFEEVCGESFLKELKEYIVWDDARSSKGCKIEYFIDSQTNKYKLECKARSQRQCEGNENNRCHSFISMMEEIAGKNYNLQDAGVDVLDNMVDAISFSDKFEEMFNSCCKACKGYISDSGKEYMCATDSGRDVVEWTCRIEERNKFPDFIEERNKYLGELQNRGQAVFGIFKKQVYDFWEGDIDLDGIRCPE